MQLPKHHLSHLKGLEHAQACRIINTTVSAITSTDTVQGTGPAVSAANAVSDTEQKQSDTALKSISVVAMKDAAAEAELAAPGVETDVTIRAIKRIKMKQLAQDYTLC